MPLVPVTPARHTAPSSPSQLCSHVPGGWQRWLRATGTGWPSCMALEKDGRVPAPAPSCHTWMPCSRRAHHQQLMTEGIRPLALHTPPLSILPSQNRVLPGSGAAASADPIPRGTLTLPAMWGCLWWPRFQGRAPSPNLLRAACLLHQFSVAS